MISRERRRNSLFSWSVEGSLARYRLAAWVVGVGLCILVFVGVPLQVWGGYLGVVKVVGPIHGIFYIIYLVAAADLVVYRLRWNVLQLLPPVLAGLVPGFAFLVERYTTRRVRMDGAGGAARPWGESGEITGEVVERNRVFP